ncbi:unnamed protein product [Owenia fusiformis]|uniref:Uncharacterized protein n=1 Tax=Owenia fusiformis TaxID=6347 RepID=A0A8J1Y7U6_OWEFU|nr:unnamed protein product [Owenia fusiformis]
MSENKNAPGSGFNTVYGPPLTAEPVGPSAPPPESGYNSAAYNTQYGAAAAPAAPPPSYNSVVSPQQHAFSISYADFLPDMTEEGGVFSSAKYERFDIVVSKANAWLRSQPHVRVSCCETLETKLRYGNIDTQKSTYYERGESNQRYARSLRVWVVSKDQNASPEPDQIGYKNLIPLCTDGGGIFGKPKFETFGETIDRFNETQRMQPVGKIINIETQEMKFSSYKENGIDPDKTSWLEYGENSQYYLFVVRVFYQLGQPAHEQVCCADFYPQQTNTEELFSQPRFEPFSSVAQQARNWLAGQYSVSLINVQSINYKIQSWTGEIDTQRSLFLEHGESTTKFIRILRVCVSKPFNQEAGLVPAPQLLNYKVFYPALLRMSTFGSGDWETQADTMKRAMAWFALTGMTPISCETIQIKSCGSEGPNAENCYTRHRGDSNYIWLYVLRLYFVGDPVEPDPSLLPPVPVPQGNDDCCNIL